MSTSKCCSLLLHEVTDDPGSTGFQRKTALPYKNTIAEFKSYLNVIAASGFPVLNIESKNFLKTDGVVLTFDDGGKSAMTASALVDEYGWKGHFFVTTSRIGERTFLSKSDIVDLRKRGHIVGSHSHSHPDIFYNLKYDEMLSEWRTSKIILEDILSEEIISASVPGGDTDEKTIKSAYQVGLKRLFTSDPSYFPKYLEYLERKIK